jgi:hypothetical protein
MTNKYKDKYLRIVACTCCPNRITKLAFGGDKVGVMTGTYITRCLLTGHQLDGLSIPDDCPLPKSPGTLKVYPIPSIT